MAARGISAAILFLIGLIGSAVAAPRNVVLFVVDDQGLDAGCYGNDVIQTPHLDRLAADGTRFDFAFCTTASCSASRSVILTGKHNHANGQFGHQHAYHNFHTQTTVQSLPVLLSKAGYRTARIGKFHVQPEEVYQFETVLSGNARNPVQMAEVCRKLVTADDPRPFFLYFCTADPHRGGEVAKELPHGPNQFGNRRQGYPGVQTIEYDPAEVVVPSFLPDSPECRAELAQYYQSVSRVDQGLGRLLSVLKDANAYDDTLVIYISDNGIAFPGAKTTLYEPGMRLPCIVRSPDQTRRGTATRAMITWADLTPTILDFAGADSQGETFHGRSFLSVLDEDEPAGWDEIYASHTFHEVTMYYPMRVVRGRRYKLIWNIAHGLAFPFASDLWEAPTWQAAMRHPDRLYGRRSIEAYQRRPRFELYDLEKDPHEIDNLAVTTSPDGGDHAAVLESLKRKMRQFQQRTSDPWILKWDYE